MWFNEIRQITSEEIPIVLVGTKIDLRNDRSQIELLAKSKEKGITREQGEHAAKQFGAQAYVECSALTQESLKETFDAAIIAALTPSTTKSNRILCCY